MSRKQATYGQLVDYFEDGRQDEKYNIYHNIYSTDAEKIKAEFHENAAFLSKRKNGVYMYHEILSITKSRGLSEERQKEILKDIGLDYIRNRAQNNLVFGVLHDDKDDNIHYHFMISSNELQSERKHRLSKNEFSEFKKDLEQKVLTKYPELEQKKLINKEPKPGREPGEKLSNKGAELKRRTGKTDQRDDVKERLKTVFSGAKNKAGFFSALEAERLEIYVHGNTIGILDKATERKHRLKTLGMLDEFNAVSQVIEKAETGQGRGDPKDASAFAKERVDTGRYRPQEQSGGTIPPDEPKVEKSADRKYSTDRVDTGKFRAQEAGQKTPDDFSGKPASENDMTGGVYQAAEPETEREREIRERKESMKKSRGNETGYGKDPSKGK